MIRLAEEDRGFEVQRDAMGRFEVTGPRVERWVQMTPLDNREAARYLQGRLRREGVERALVRAGARAGDDVAIGDALFEFTPELDDLPEDEREAVLAGELDGSQDEEMADGAFEEPDGSDDRGAV